jgi:hypothetical protein
MTATAHPKLPREDASGLRALDPYRVVATLGENDVDAVHLARVDGAHGFSRWVVLRVFDRVHARELCAQARVAATITHPSLTAVFDVGDRDGVGWVATEYVLGETVDAILRKAERAVEPVPWAIAARIVADAADALAAIHGRPGCVHGSVGARSVLVAYSGTTKLKPAFAPKRGRVPGAASADVAALAALLWELCAGRRLDAAQPVPSLALLVGVPESIDAALQRALGGGTARELARALREALVAERVLVEEHDVGGYVQARFAEKRREREAQLRDGDAEPTEVLRRAPIEAPDTVRELPWGDEDEYEVGDETLVMRRRESPVPAPTFVKAQPVIVIGPELPAPQPSPRPAAGTPAPAAAVVARPAPRPQAPVAKKRARWSRVAVPTLLLVAASAAAGMLVRPAPPRFWRAETPATPATTNVTSASLPAAAPAPTAPESIAPSPPPAVSAAPVPAPTSTAAPVAAARPATAARPHVAPAPAPRAKGYVTVVCIPACDDVRDGARSLGESPVFKANVGAGEHHLTLVTRDPAIEKQVAIVVDEGETVLVREEMP